MRNQFRGTAFARTSLALLGLLITPTLLNAQITVTGVGRYDFTDTSGSGARELSGITYSQTSGSLFYAVGDDTPLVHKLAITINPTSGQITSTSIDPSPIVLNGVNAPDREAIVVQGDNFLIANEFGAAPKLETFNIGTGFQNGFPITSSAVHGLDIYAGNVRPNRSWESLSAYPSDPGLILLANEDALTVDGPAADFTNGAVVRIQAAFADAANSTATAIGQFAYPTDAINGDNTFVSGETSGLVELLVLQDNTVIAMERAVGFSGYRIRLYEVNGDSATDVSGLAGLDGLTPGVDYTPLSKTLLWENTFSVLTNSNFEGLALGPILDDGEQSLIIIADNASGPVLPVFGQQWTAQDQSLYSLTLDQFYPGCSGGHGCLDADLDHTGFVGIGDLNIILSRWNDVVLPGSGPDPNVDGFVGIEDLNIVLGSWNSGTPPSTDALIPEPATLALLLCSAGTLIRRQ